MMVRGVAALSCAAGMACAEPTHELVLIQGLSPVSGVAVDVNDAGVVIGYETGSGTGGAITAGFHFSTGTYTRLQGPSGFSRLEPASISDDGVMVGWWAPQGVFAPRALRWAGSGAAPTEIATLGGGDSGALAISADGACIAGWADPPAGSYGVPVGFRGFRRTSSDGVSQTGSLPVGHWSNVSAVSNGGMSAGEGGCVFDTSRAALFHPELGPIDLGTLGGLGSRALDINESLEVAGTSHTGAESGGFWIEHAFRWSSGAMTDLAPLAGFSTSWGTAINDDGVVVGHSIQRVSGSAWTWRATMWVENEPVDLNTLIAPGSGAVIERAEGINNHGWIVGQARVGGQLRPILLRPLP